MKTIVAIVIGLMSFSMAQAQVCNQNAQDCSELWVGSIQRYEATLRANPIFMRDGVPGYTQEFQKYTQSWKNCSTWLCRNRTTQGWHDKVMWMMMDYEAKQKQQSKVTSAVPADKWADQCVVAAKPNVVTYSDMSAANKVGGVSENVGYKVSQTNGGKYVGLTNSQDGKFVGWAKKSELQMQDLRNCN